MKRLLLSLALVLSFDMIFAFEASAANLYPCVNKKGQLLAKKRCGRGETRLTKKALSKSGLIQPRSSRELLAKDCKKRNKITTGAGMVTAMSSCARSETLVSGQCSSNSKLYKLRASYSLKANSDEKIVSSAGIYRCIIEDLNRGLKRYKVTTTAWCCTL